MNKCITFDSLASAGPAGGVWGRREATGGVRHLRWARLPARLHTTPRPNWPHKGLQIGFA